MDFGCHRTGRRNNLLYLVGLWSRNFNNKDRCQILDYNKSQIKDTDFHSGLSEHPVRMQTIEGETRSRKWSGEAIALLSYESGWKYVGTVDGRIQEY
jgi:hypothetical protein